MSKAVPRDREVPEHVVRNRSQYADTLHRQNPERDEPAPACPLQPVEKGYTTVPRDAYLGHYELCGDPECFGGEWR